MRVILWSRGVQLVRSVIMPQIYAVLIRANRIYIWLKGKLTGNNLIDTYFWRYTVFHRYEIAPSSFCFSYKKMTLIAFRICIGKKSKTCLSTNRMGKWEKPSPTAQIPRKMELIMRIWYCLLSHQMDVNIAYYFNYEIWMLWTWSMNLKWNKCKKWGINILNVQHERFAFGSKSMNLKWILKVNIITTKLPQSILLTEMLFLIIQPKWILFKCYIRNCSTARINKFCWLINSWNININHIILKKVEVNCQFCNYLFIPTKLI